MKVVICGAGQVGFGIAERLAAEANDVSIIDTSPALIRAIADKLDVRGFVGHGSHPDVLAQAGCEHADMLIAVTVSDEVNMTACQMAHAIFNVPTKIARIRSQSYLQPQWSDIFARDTVPVDVVISPEREVSDAILRRIAVPGAYETIAFADERVIVAAIDCRENCPVVDTPLKQLTELFPDLKARVIGIKRDDRVFSPTSEDFLCVGDLAYVAAERGQVARTLVIFGHDEPPARRVVILGGGTIGVNVARTLETKLPGTQIKIVEQDRARATQIADSLNRSVVLNGSALDPGILREADVSHADAVVSVTNDEKVNILASGLGKRLGAARSLCLVTSTVFSDLIAGLGIDTQINPRGVTVSRVLRHVRRGRIRAVHSVLDGRAEIVEAEALETSPLVGRPLRELDLFSGMRIGAILRRGDVIMPTGDTVVKANDRVVLFAEQDKVRQVEQLFRVSLEFF